ncbi:c-type heme family protein [Shimia haliotis]|uniref:Tll0287-like domain-containing protein n=1 Tax=Shimia haliotis TaxID=1280847 RepID=A0A1I4B9A0_9RHOB|nr:DUF3365 domain-containing protein [Shimia haliotis]SFK64539.1 hypothetical protein SAMN04488036_101853 [Shimia haliotis]
MMKIFVAGVFGCLMVYLFATAPVALPDNETANKGRCHFAVATLFDGVNAINDAARSLYTQKIVGNGKLAGLAFGEDWQEPGVEKGPLPALFLRLTAARLEAKPPRMGLYLGSDAPINRSNLFSPEQLVSFETVKATRAPVFMTSQSGGHVGMYPDVAGVAPCVDCHNEHKDSPKTDWKLGDVMGATTWTYPDAMVSADEYVLVVEAMLASVQEAYQQYLDKAAGFEEPVEQAKEWPDKGRRYLPTPVMFMAEVRAQAAPSLVNALMPAHHTTGGASPCVF